MFLCFLYSGILVVNVWNLIFYRCMYFLLYGIRILSFNLLMFDISILLLKFGCVLCMIVLIFFLVGISRFFYV